MQLPTNATKLIILNFQYLNKKKYPSNFFVELSTIPNVFAQNKLHRPSSILLLKRNFHEGISRNKIYNKLYVEQFKRKLCRGFMAILKLRRTPAGAENIRTKLGMLLA